MKQSFRPRALAFTFLGLVLVVALLVFWPIDLSTPSSKATARPVPEGDQEVVWLNAATSAVSWERFVAAIHRIKVDRPELVLEILADADPFPSQTAEVPELAIRIAGQKHFLWFRWYKLTGDLTTAQWVQAFARRRPIPLAIIGGSSSDRARDLARELSGLRLQIASSPVLLITTATADRVGLDDKLMQLYPARSFRYCFTNHQIAEAVADFIWSQRDLRPDVEPVYMVRWEDDPYSEDLFDQFHSILGPDGFGRQLQLSHLLLDAARSWVWLAALAAGGGPPFSLELDRLRRLNPDPPGPFWSMPIPYSEGGFGRPNPWDAEAAEKLMTELGQHQTQQRPLLVLPATPQPARRLLRALVRIAPIEAGRFIIATGDAIDFNTVYRDRTFAWSIQDLPLNLVCFCHRNPVDPVAFELDQAADEDLAPDPFGRTSTGTQDLLLYRDIVSSLVEAAYKTNGLESNPDDLALRLRSCRLPDGQPRFDEEGNPPTGSGEFVVCLRPVRVGDRVLPQARLQVWQRIANTRSPMKWNRVPIAGQAELMVDYSRPIASSIGQSTE